VTTRYLIAAHIDGEIRYLQAQQAFPYNKMNATNLSALRELELTPIKWVGLEQATRWQKGSAKIWWNWVFKVVETAEIRMSKV